ncbi:hypothetical protein A3715_05990 [Oleiphilus sp. HI0009]|uniref:late competence development ComFB family protein n=1 Tax=unclassified Oleiphilus TaxID=2631174 RepID=UPI0007C3BDE8|nr:MULTISPECIES: late competence development ComFB family protein [unclassified Oleiphilus]KZX81297.1 hypothetical protein A3715_18950 [Oleiphilus sp. HI0009]MCH2157527.1 late competence development ComFB family protein [Oleiphilaceae bacterium]KZX82835.1 hypothetical protein A3715_05990 [Oleiphilus sp. HI0009]KZY64445.1 hypothetical protein A3738_10345 [Oleiphilus sp. HI0066]KZY67726.1 hypothetical protein A3739_11965 [Oleiphilus sp. HI0067]
MSVLDSIFNYHERLVVDEMSKQLKKHTFSEAQLSDIACLALNKVPAKYIKHSVDRAFYTSDVERMEIAAKIEKAVAEAIAYIASAKH